LFTFLQTLSISSYLVSFALGLILSFKKD
jgi:hypothetical protein